MMRVEPRKWLSRMPPSTAFLVLPPPEEESGPDRPVDRPPHRWGLLRYAHGRKIEPDSSELFGYLFKPILESHVIYKQQDDWDGEGSLGHSESTWWRAVNFLIRHAIAIWQGHGRRIEAPKIWPGPEGSIDLHWESMASELLINVPASSDEPISFYGDDRGAQKIKGTLSDSPEREAHNLLLWLTTK